MTIPLHEVYVGIGSQPACGRCRRAKIDAAADNEVAFTFKNGTQRKFTGKPLLLTFSIPRFFSCHRILRHAGVDIAKKDFLGPPR